ncbi:Cyclic di-GMP phosphodiesterase Gmr [Pigmentiphaga humi]|uniref:Cyclic di-GMP phosphodiesterase Gmr n=1 Tax=Pigmentiphaga humi TaxID=2478468 RepID=A0A3P4B5M3_9BURK|nr:bifunctional diguanylate cyclase/phosphodiesterase [Pigmentiphaga humi]VCU71609.1 Cyclic di-GMP phosphodiesterase Gmr [Pigmentiphaga humi]
MMTVLGCVVDRHNIWLVALAVLVCTTGSWVTVRLFMKSSATRGVQRLGWHMLTAVASGTAIWCTHFVAMLGFRPGVPVALDPAPTMLSLLLAVAGATPGFVLAGSKRLRWAPALGGAMVGLAICAMHYVGMMAYRVQGIVTWNRTYLVASVALAVVFSSLALHAALRVRNGTCRVAATGLLVMAIACLHFVGMTAFQVEPVLLPGNFSNPEAWQALGLAVGGVALVIVAAGLASYLIDDSLRTESLERLRRMAMTDSLTGLPNRASFSERLDRELYLADQAGGRVALVGMDLDRFKEINDLRGHAAGDEVLRELARRMSALLQEGEFVARQGGDEFIAIHRLGEQSRLLDFLARLESAFFTPIRLEGYEVIPGASLGVAVYPDDAQEKEALIGNTDLAMYRAKSDLVNVACFYEPSMDEVVRARRTLAGELRAALEFGQMDIHYQVQTAVSTGDIRGYEALLRWRHPERGYIPPSEFIPLAEESGLILQLGEWVLRTACAKAASWNPPYKVAVNLSAVQFVHADLVELVRSILDETGLQPDRLELELTESTIFMDKELSLRILRQIKQLGVGIALDDFGTGYSSLDTLRTFPFDKIKLDCTFVSELESSPQARAIVRAVLALGKSLDIPVLAEGIETHGQLALLNAEGCDEGQGYLLGRPIPLRQIVDQGDLVLSAAHEARMRVFPPEVMLAGRRVDGSDAMSAHP